MDDAFARDYATTTNAGLAARYGVSERTVARWAAARGLRKSAEHIRRLAQERNRARDPSAIARGASHWNWKGGRPWLRFRDPRYLEWRRSVLERDGYRCQHCGRQCRKYERGLAAHHVREWASAPEARFDVTNGMTLCRDCHMTLHGLGPRVVERVPCACGCGTLIAARDIYGRPRRYVNHHEQRGRAMTIAARELLSRARKGRRLSSDHRAKISQGLRSSEKRIGRPPRTSTRASGPPSS
jgi:5-methylcytosine-specific restriction endonuclease McrA